MAIAEPPVAPTIEVTRLPTTPDEQAPRPRKPSEIIRDWPDELWCGCVSLRRLPDGRVQHCANGILATVAGYDWSRDIEDAIRSCGCPACRSSTVVGPACRSSTVVGPYPTEFICRYYALHPAFQALLAQRNDMAGKGAAADLLEKYGL